MAAFGNGKLVPPASGAHERPERDAGGPAAPADHRADPARGRIEEKVAAALQTDRPARARRSCARWSTALSLDQPAASWRTAIERIADQLLAAQGRPRPTGARRMRVPPEPRRRGQASRQSDRPGRRRTGLPASSRRCGRSIPTAGSWSTTGRSIRSARMLRCRHDRPRPCTTRRGTSRRDFIVASLDPLRALPILRVPGTGREPGPERAPARRAAAGARGDAGAGRERQPGRQLRLACRRAAAERSRVGDPARLERAAGAAGAGDRDPGRGAGGRWRHTAGKADAHQDITTKGGISEWLRRDKAFCTYFGYCVCFVCRYIYAQRS